MHRVVATILMAGAILTAQADPTPRTIDEFRAAAARILEEFQIPGAGISLVRADGVEWEGGLGVADRRNRTPVTVDTHFRVGSISKTFVAIALTDLYGDGLLDLDDPVARIAPELDIDNPWNATDPVRVIHLLQHTAGLDDMHFREMYNLDDPVDLPLEYVLRRHGGPWRIRWRPGTRMSYSNPGYTMAGLLIEKITGEHYEDFIERKILQPLGMYTSSFRLTPADETILARGYADAAGPPVGYPQIYLRPAGNLHSSPREMGRFVRMLLNWGELDRAFVIDPEYLGNLERSRTTLAATAGLRNGYGSGLMWTLSLPFPVLGHDGGIDGFTSAYGYSPSRDVGYVVLLNSSARGAGRAAERLASLAIRYLKRDVEPPAKPEARLDRRVLDQYTGFYEEASPRNALLWPIQFLFSGRTVVREGDSLYIRQFNRAQNRLVPVSDTQFRFEHDIEASWVFTRDPDGRMVLAGRAYLERVPRWRVELVRLPVLATIPIVLSPVAIGFVWLARVRRARPHGFWALKSVLLVCPLVPAAAALALRGTPVRDWGSQNLATILVFLASLALPTLAVIVAALTVAAWRESASRWLVGYAALVAVALAGMSTYLGVHGLLGIRLWAS